MFKTLNKNKRINPGDIQICSDSKGNPVIVPYRDRLPNTLIVGPTGAGKITYSFLPMIYQDIQNKDCGVVIFEPDYNICDKTYAMAKYCKRKVVYFNPSLPMCPHFNPMTGNEINVIENITGAFEEFNKGVNRYYLDIYKNLLSYSIVILKRLFKDEVNLSHLDKLINNSCGYGKSIVEQFSKLSNLEAEQSQEHQKIISWFKCEYFNDKSRIYADCIEVRSQLKQLISNKYLKRILEPSNKDNALDLKEHIKNGDVVIISTNLGISRDMGRLLGYLLIFEYQCAVSNRINNHKSILNLKFNSIYINEFQIFCNRGFVDVLTQGRLCKVVSNIGIQNIESLPERFKDIVLTNARNILVYPGISKESAEYFASLFNSINKDIQFNSEDLMYGNFGEISYLHTHMNKYKTPSVGKVSSIPKDVYTITELMCEVLYDCVHGYNNKT